MANIGFSKPPPILGDPMNQTKPPQMKPRPMGMAEPIAPRPPRNPPLGPRLVVDPAQALQSQFGQTPTVDPAMAQAFQAQHGIAQSAMPQDVQRLIPGQRPVEIAPPTGMQSRPMRPYQPFRNRGLR